MNSVDIINRIVDYERSINNKGHITFIFLSCRGFHQSLSGDEKKLMRLNSSKIDKLIQIVIVESTDRKNDLIIQRRLLDDLNFINYDDGYT